MTALIESGRLVDIALLAMGIELAILAIVHRRTGRGLAPRRLVPTLVAGAGLLAALREAITSASAAWIAAWLTAALVAHLIDLGMRWRDAGASAAAAGRGLRTPSRPRRISA